MIPAQRQHQTVVINLICEAFRQDPQFLAYTQGKPARISLIARLAFETCLATNTIFLTDDLNAVVLCKPSIGGQFNLRAWLIQGVFPFVFGLTSLRKLIHIENILEKNRQHSKNGLYIWMLATNPMHQGKGLGSTLLDYIDTLTPHNFSDIFLETCRISNVHYYRKRGYVLYHQLNIEPDLNIMFMRKSSA